MSGQNREVVAAEVPLGEVPSLLSESEKEAIAEAEAEAQQAVENQRTDERIDSMAYNNNHRPMLANDIHEHGLCMAVSLSLQSLWRTLLDIVAHLVVFFMLAQFSWQSVISVSTAAGFTAFYIYFDNGSMAAKLDWQFVSFALVFPVTFFLAETWRRRERGLSKMAGIKSLSLWMYLAHRDWVRPEKLPAEHLPMVKTVLIRILCDLHGYVTLRRLTTRDLYFAVGHNKRFLEFEAKRRAWRRELYIQMKLMSRLCENLKDYGLPTNEASRLNQYHSLFLRDVEEVMNIKDYRTPQGIRSFTRVYVILIWTMFGSYFAWVAQETSSVAFAICLAITCALALTGLTKVSMKMEDPFECDGVDGVRTSRDLAEIIIAIRDDSLEESLTLLKHGNLEGETVAPAPQLEGQSMFPILKAQKQERWRDYHQLPMGSGSTVSPIKCPGGSSATSSAR